MTLQGPRFGGALCFGASQSVPIDSMANGGRKRLSSPPLVLPPGKEIPKANGVQMNTLTEPQLEALKASLVSLGRECVATCSSETKRLGSAAADSRSDSHRRSEEERILLEAYKDLLHDLVRVVRESGGTAENTGQLFPAVAQSVANQLIGPRRPRLYRFRGLESFQRYTELNGWISELERKMQVERERVEAEFKSGRGS
jgi:hypothetical protein